MLGPGLGNGSFQKLNSKRSWFLLEINILARSFRNSKYSYGTERTEEKKKTKTFLLHSAIVHAHKSSLWRSAAGKALTTDSCAGQRSLALHWTLSILESNPVSFTSADSDPLQIQTYGRWCIYMPLIVLILGSLFVLHVNMHYYLSWHDDCSNFG